MCERKKSETPAPQYGLQPCAPWGASARARLQAPRPSRAGDARILRLRAYLPPATGFTRPMPAPPTHLAVTGFNVEHRLVKICWQ